MGDDSIEGLAVKYIERSELLFLGTGTSGGVPELSCLTNFDETTRCAVCHDAQIPGSKNRRRNTSVVLKTSFIPEGASDNDPRIVTRNILIDCGKFFFPAALDHFAMAGIHHLDAVIITHAHADAFMGVDDLREYSCVKDRPVPLPVLVREQDLDEIGRVYPYLMNRGKTKNNMHIPMLSFDVYHENEPFQVCGLNFTPLKVDHGPGVTCTALSIGGIIYMSDCNNIPKSIDEWISSNFCPSDSSNYGIKDPKSNLKRLDLLIIDSLWPKEPYNSHFSLEQALDVIRKYRPTKAFTVGMSHQFDHSFYNQYLKQLSQQEMLDVELAFDGQILPIDLPISSLDSFLHISPAKDAKAPYVKNVKNS